MVPPGSSKSSDEEMIRAAMRSILAGMAWAALCAQARADNWPTWRGPDSRGIAQEKSLPVKWSPTENIRWKVKLPASGNSTPVIWGDRVFLTQSTERTLWPPKVPLDFPKGTSPGGHAVAEKRSVLCFHRIDGKLLWQRDVIYKDKEPTHGTNPFCSASPVTDG